jgi:hypothetical protein
VRPTPKGALFPFFVVVALALIAGCSYASRLSEQEARDVARDVDGQVFYVGTTFEGLPLTYAQKFPENSPINGVSFGYGDCEPPGNEGGCPLPLEIQNAICPDEHTKVGIFGSPAGLRQRAAHSLRPVGGGDAPAPEVVIDTGPICSS